MSGITINGKFVGAPLNGVHRTAALFAEALITAAEEAVPITVAVPSTVSEEHLSALPPSLRQASDRVPFPLRSGQLWENVALPWSHRGALLLNFCNLAPVLHPRSVVMIHDAQTFLYPEDYGGWQARAYRALLPRVGKSARCVLTVSEFARQSLAAFGIADLEKIHVVHNGTDHFASTPPDRSVLDRFELAGSPFLLTMGSAKGYKNMRRLFDVMSTPDFAGRRLVVAGGPLADAYDEDPPPNVLFLGRVTDQELKALYGAAHLFLFPSYTEGFGLPPVEAMHEGCPVIASDAGALPEVCADAALLCPPDDSRAWREAITSFDDRHRRAACVAKSRARATALTWARAGRALWETVRPLLLTHHIVGPALEVRHGSQG